MTHGELVSHIQQLIQRASDHTQITGTYAQVCEFLRTYAGPNNSFLESVQTYAPHEVGDEGYAAANIVRILRSYLQYVEAGLNAEISPERKAQLDVVSDFLEMAQLLLDTKGV